MRRRPAGLARLGTDLDQTLKRLEIAGAARDAMAVTLWPEVVGEHFAAATRATGMRNGVLEIRARSSAWVQEITFQKAEILRRLNRRLGAQVVTDFRCRVDPFETPPPEAPEAAAPDADEVAAIELPAAVRARVERETRQKDPEIAALVRRALTRHWQLDEWRRRHGYRPCPGCGTLVEPGHGECPACQARKNVR